MTRLMIFQFTFLLRCTICIGEINIKSLLVVYSKI